MNGDHGLALGAQLRQQRYDRPLSRGVHPRERLIHQVEVGILHERAGKQHSLLLTARQLADLPPGEIRHADLVERLEGGLPLPGARTPQPAEPAIEAHHHHIEHVRGKIPVDRGTLGYVGHPLTHFRIGLTEEAHPAGRLRYET